MGIPPISSNQGAPNCGWNPSFQATHSVAAHIVMSTIPSAMQIWPQSTLVDDIPANCGFHDRLQHGLP
jgi:hypothetical protein